MYCRECLTYVPQCEHLETCPHCGEYLFYGSHIVDIRKFYKEELDLIKDIHIVKNTGNKYFTTLEYEIVFKQKYRPRYIDCYNESSKLRKNYHFGNSVEPKDAVIVKIRAKERESDDTNEYYYLTHNVPVNVISTSEDTNFSFVKLESQRSRKLSTFKTWCYTSLFFASIAGFLVALIAYQGILLTIGILWYVYLFAPIILGIFYIANVLAGKSTSKAFSGKIINVTKTILIAIVIFVILAMIAVILHNVFGDAFINDAHRPDHF